MKNYLETRFLIKTFPTALLFVLIAQSSHAYMGLVKQFESDLESHRRLGTFTNNFRRINEYCREIRLQSTGNDLLKSNRSVLDRVGAQALNIRRSTFLKILNDRIRKLIDGANITVDVPTEILFTRIQLALNAAPPVSLEGESPQDYPPFVEACSQVAECDQRLSSTVERSSEVLMFRLNEMDRLTLAEDVRLKLSEVKKEFLETLTYDQIVAKQQEQLEEIHQKKTESQRELDVLGEQISLKDAALKKCQETIAEHTGQCTLLGQKVKDLTLKQSFLVQEIEALYDRECEVFRKSRMVHAYEDYDYVGDDKAELSVLVNNLLERWANNRSEIYEPLAINLKRKVTLSGDWKSVFSSEIDLKVSVSLKSNFFSEEEKVITFRSWLSSENQRFQLGHFIENCLNEIESRVIEREKKQKKIKKSFVGKSVDTISLRMRSRQS